MDNTKRFQHWLLQCPTILLHLMSNSLYIGLAALLNGKLSQVPEHVEREPQEHSQCASKLGYEGQARVHPVLLLYHDLNKMCLNDWKGAEA